ncbi:MAG: ribose-phosphate pyrophosphokinase [Candidatus Aenigmarchaeota archaeon]|nr:ribose-phosphate pyrophosphokinase [Candidatus Aenigmarchaeota archaeon]
MEKQVGIVVPDYSEHLGIPGPYFGDEVFAYLEERHPRKFERIPITIKGAADSSEEAMTQGDVRERRVYVLHPIHTTAARHFMIALEMADDLYRSDAASVVLFELYNRYFSYDKRKRKQSLNARVVADGYLNAGYRRVFTFEPHSESLGLAFDKRCSLEAVPTDVLLAAHYRERYPLLNTTVAAPDVGGYARAEAMADHLGLPLIGMRKHRSMDKSDQTKASDIIGDARDVEGKIILLRDDVIRTAGSLESAAQMLRDRGAKEIRAVVTHIDLVGKARERILNNIDLVVATNTVPQALSPEEKKRYDIVDLTEMTGEVIYRRSEGMPLSSFFPNRLNHRK